MKTKLQALAALARRNAAKVSGAVLAVSVGAAHAVPADITTALNEAKTDGVTIGGLVLGVIVAIFAFKLMRRAL